MASSGGSSPTRGGAIMRNLFSTPLFSENIAGLVDLEALTALATDGYSRVVNDHDSLASEIVEHKSKDCMDPTSILRQQFDYDRCKSLLKNPRGDFNHHERFFHWQTYQGAQGLRKWDEFRSSAELKAVTMLVQNRIIDFLYAMGIARQQLEQIWGHVRLQIWAAVDKSSTFTHVHFTRGNCVCSGVLYVNVPTGSGAITFEDIRQPRTEELTLGDGTPLFPSTGYSHAPAAGDLLLFPPWAPHKVEPTHYTTATKKRRAGGEMRVAWAFNLNVVQTSSETMSAEELSRAQGAWEAQLESFEKAHYEWEQAKKHAVGQTEVF